MPQKWLYDPIDNMMAAFCALPAFQSLMDAADATEALERCVFLGTSWDVNGDEEIVLPGAIFGIMDGMKRTKGSSSQFRTTDLTLWVIIQSVVPASYSDTHATPGRWWCDQLQDILDEFEQDIVARAAGAMDVRSINVSNFPRQSREELNEGASRDYWWAALEMGVGG